MEQIDTAEKLVEFLADYSNIRGDEFQIKYPWYVAPKSAYDFIDMICAKARELTR
jgi:hypothetical protein